MCPVPNGFRDRAISLYSPKTVDKKEILRTVSNIGIYCSSDKVGTVIIFQHPVAFKYSVHSFITAFNATFCTFFKNVKVLWI
jgi:hypothetical protein